MNAADAARAAADAVAHLRSGRPALGPARPRAAIQEPAGRLARSLSGGLAGWLVRRPAGRGQADRLHRRHRLPGAAPGPVTRGLARPIAGPSLATKHYGREARRLFLA